MEEVGVVHAQVEAVASVIRVQPHSTGQLRAG